MHPAVVGYVYLLLCLLVGLVGVNRKFGFWGYFFGSIILSPIWGLLMVLASDPRKPKELSGD